MTSELCLRTIAELAPQVKKGAISALELTDACLEQITKREADLNAFIAVDRDGARATANRADDEIAAGQYRGRQRHRESGQRHQLNMMQPSLPTLRLRAQSCSANAICTSSRLVQQEKIRHSGQPVIPMTLRGHPAVPAVARRQLSRPVCLMDRSEQIPEDQYGSLQQRAALLA